MTLVVISSPDTFKAEADQVNALFAAGMQRFHLRKPGAGLAAVNALLSAIDPQYLQDVVLHQHHELADKFQLQRLHFPEELRTSATEQVEAQLSKGRALSSSIHQLGGLSELAAFEYVFFSPVFNSISKSGYSAALAPEFRLPDRSDPPAVYALGGVDASKLGVLKTMNFDGAAVLGAIWNTGDDPVQQFNSIQESMTFHKERPQNKNDD